MRLKRLDLMRYGKFTDRVLDFGDRPASGPDLHLIYGPNEAGKSTAFDAFLSLLFGVPSRSPYDFLHSYKTMQVGGLIETGHGPFDLIRTKANSHDLRRASGELLAPGALGAILGGLSREAYRAMFSLDEKSLEDGGKAILESQGELGQMLFAASSGLPGIAAVLEGARADADSLFKKNAHKTKMRELLNTLEALKKQQGDIDINASRYDDLRRAAEQAQAAHAKAEAGRNARSTRLREVRQLLAALPLAGKRAVKHALHAPLANLPAPPDGWIAQAGKLALDEAQLVARQAANDLAVARLMTDIAGLTPNVPMLAAAAQITTLKPLRARHDTAEIDLPKRIEARALAQDELSQKVRELGLAADVDPASLLLPAPVTAQLQALADQHIGLATGLDTAAAELRAVTQKRDAAQADMGAQEATGAPVALRDDSALDDLLARLLRDSPHTEHARLAEELTHEARNVAAGLAALRPFSGTTAELASLSVPEAVALHRWSTALRSADDTLAREAGKVTDRETQLGSAIARSAALRAQPGLVDDAALATLASARTQAWQDHRAAIVRRSAALDPTADAYAAAASAERGALIARTHQAAALEAMRMAELAMAEAGHALDAAKLLHARALAARAQLQQEVDAALLACTLPTTLHVDDFAGWLKRRDDCLKAQSALAQREARLAALAHRMAHDRMQLADAGIIGAPEIPFAALVAQAQAATRAAAAAKSTRDAKAKAVAELTRQLAERTDRHTDLARRLQGWESDWREALHATWLMRSGIPPSVVEVRTALALLVEISAGVQATSKLTRQISTMQEDQARFAASLAQACNAASHAFDPARLAVCADELDAALTAAQQTQALARDKARALAQAHVDRQTLKGDVQLLSAQRNVMCARYGVDTIALLRDALDDAAKATRLAQEIVMLETELLAALCVPGLAVALARLEGMDLAALQAEADRLEREQTAADSDIQTLHHANRTARQAFDSIGADGRVAALMENRRTTMLEIGDTATRYLRLRLGAEAIDSALRAYRDRHRSGMLRDAALRFTHITGGSFSDLRTQMSDKGETLVGVQQGGGSLLADAMSKGTRDQLFLALRMAGYLEFAKSREPLPFIADDVMETFDDTRASATFGMLAQIARHGQVIYLTHHEHLCDLARKACGDGVHIMRF